MISAILNSAAFGAFAGSFVATALVVTPRIRALIRKELRPIIVEEVQVAVRAQLLEQPAAGAGALAGVAQEAR